MANEILGTADDDAIEGTDNNDIIRAGAGNDVIFAGQGDDSVYGEDGDDIIFTSYGDDFEDGGAGNDTLATYGTTDYMAVTYNLSNGSQGETGGVMTQNAFANFENFEAGYNYWGETRDINWDFTIIGSSEANRIVTSSGQDVLQGAEGDDVLDGGAGEDTAVYSGSRSDFSLTISDGVITVSDLTGDEGTDLVSNIETLQFADLSINVGAYTGWDTDSAETPVEQISTHSSLTVIVDAGVLGESPFLLSDLTETVTTQNGVEIAHTVAYNGFDFNYAQIDALIMDVVRDGEFTAEFQQEIADFAPSVADITYADAITLVGVDSINEIIVLVAGADGNYVE